MTDREPLSGAGVVGDELEEQVFPASFAQQRLWFIEQMEVAGATYTVPAAWRFRQDLDAGVLQQAVAALVARHETLRTVFRLRDGVPVQIIQDAGAPGTPLRVEDLSGTGNSSDRLAELLRQEAATRFDLATGPLFRLTLIRLGPNDTVLAITMHHIVCDAWSMEILYRELSQLYTAIRDGRDPALPTLPVQYADYSVWQRELLQGEKLEAELAFWRGLLAPPLPALALPTDRPRPPVQTFNGSRLAITVPAEVGRAVLDAGRAEGATPFITILTAYQVFLARETGQDDIIVGSPISGRNQAELEGLIGFFLNTLAFRADVSGNPEFRACLRRTRDYALAAYAHQELPFERLVEALTVERDTSRPPVFQSMFVYQTRAAEVRIAGATAEPVSIPAAATAKFDLLVSVTEHDGQLRISFEYNTDLFERERVRRWADHFAALLGGIATSPATAIGALPFLSAAETTQALETWNGERRALPLHASVIELVEAQMAARPTAVAVEHDAVRVTYRDIQAAMESLAGRLQRLGVGPDVPVAVALDRSPDMIVAVLAVLKAGGAYVPVDPTYPPERIAVMLEDSRAPVVLTRSSLKAALPPTSATVLAVDALPAEPNAAGPAPAGVQPHHLAYVIYTSGSTGRPKGVAMPHAPLLNLLDWQFRRSPVGAGGRSLQFASLSFDVSFQEIFSTLGSGGTLVLVSEEVRRDPAALLALLDAHGVQRLFLPYIALQHLADAAVREGRSAVALLDVITAGEQLYVTPNIRRWLGTMTRPRLDNQYGPSETHVVTAHLLEGNPDGWPAVPPIGAPIQNVRTYVLGPGRQPVSQGTPGDLWLGGVGVARGYLHQPDLTAERFVPDPFVAGERMYRSGDLARHLPDGGLDFLGRIDHQVKIRGHRVELGEIESLIAGHPEVSACAVIAPADASGSRQIVAFVVPRGNSEGLEARVSQHVKAALPAYMVPSRVILRTALPLTPSGKVNRRALEVPAAPAAERGPQLVPETTLEAVVIGIWEELLPGRVIGPGDDFFALGGHSLLAARMVDDIAKITGHKLPLTMLFRGATVREIARFLLVGVQAEERPKIVEVQKGRPGVTPFFMAHGDFTAGGFYCRAMARAAGEDQPFYAIPPYLPDGQEPRITVEAMAAGHIPAIRHVQPHGPYRIGGYCAGGLVAYEIARQLRDAGETVELLLLVDAKASNLRYSWIKPFLDALCRARGGDAVQRADRFAYLMARVWKVRRLPRGELIAYIAGFPARFVARRTRRLFRKARQSPGTPAQPVAGDRPPIIPGVHAHYTRAMLTYFPKRFDGPVQLLWATGGGHPPSVRELGWGQVAGKVELTTTPLSHVAVVTAMLPTVFADAIARMNGKTRP